MKIKAAFSRVSLTTATVMTRWILGGVFLVTGATKVLHPVDFLVALRSYHLFENPLAMNLIAVILPWLEVLCGFFLLVGLAVRGCALLSLVMLVTFSLIVLQRSLELYSSAAISFCALRFDCGCGSGEVAVCHKLLENGFLSILAAWCLAVRTEQWSLRYDRRSRDCDSREIV